MVLKRRKRKTVKNEKKLGVRLVTKNILHSTLEEKVKFRYNFKSVMTQTATLSLVHAVRFLKNFLGEYLRRPDRVVIAHTANPNTPVTRG